MRSWLKKIREEAKITQEAVAERAGISGTYFNMIERGERGNPLKVDTAKAIAAALGFDWTRFYEQDESVSGNTGERTA